jgi:hypothetical protein
MGCQGIIRDMIITSYSETSCRVHKRLLIRIGQRVTQGWHDSLRNIETWDAKGVGIVSIGLLVKGSAHVEILTCGEQIHLICLSLNVLQIILVTHATARE